MKHSIGWIGLAIVSFAACQQQEPAAAPLAAPPAAEPVATTPPPAPAIAEVAKPAPPPPATADERSKWLSECWGLFNAKDFTKFSGCYAENATSEQVDLGTPPLAGRQNIVDKNAKVFATAFPDLTAESELTLVSGDEILSVILLKGTHQGPLPGPQGEVAATKKKIGYLALHHVQTTPDGRAIQKERFIYDGGTFMSQLGLSPGPGRKALEQGWADTPALVSGGTDAEKANVAALAAYTAAFNKHDAAAASATLTDDATFADLSSPADRVGKKEVTKSAEDLFKGFPDVKLEQTSVWAAGDYVVAAGRFSGTNTGDMPGMKLKKTGKAMSVEYYLVSKLAGGKIKNLWMFSNGLAFAGQLGLLPPPKPSKPAPPAAGPGKDTKMTATPAAPSGGPKPAGTPAPPAPAASPAPPPAGKPAPAPGAAPAPKEPKAPAAAPPPAAPKGAKPVAPPAAATPPAAPKAPTSPVAPTPPAPPGGGAK